MCLICAYNNIHRWPNGIRRQQTAERPHAVDGCRANRRLLGAANVGVVRVAGRQERHKTAENTNVTMGRTRTFLVLIQWNKRMPS